MEAEFKSRDELIETVIELVDMGLVEPFRVPGESELRFRLTDAGREALAS
jgi:hypothetical protein